MGDSLLTVIVAIAANVESAFHFEDVSNRDVVCIAANHLTVGTGGALVVDRRVATSHLAAQAVKGIDLEDGAGRVDRRDHSVDIRRIPQFRLNGVDERANRDHVAHKDHHFSAVLRAGASRGCVE